MAPAYQNVSSGQVVVSDAPRSDLEALARWKEVPVPDETEVAHDSAPPAEDLVTEIVSDDPNGEPVEIVGVSVEDGEITTPAVVEMANGSEVETDEDGNPILTPISDDDEEVPVPDETWTDEALDALAKERGVTYRSNASKATKVAKLTAPAGE